jgi:hypothetical protein
MEQHYHALYKAGWRAIKFLESEGYTIRALDLKGNPFQLIASNETKTRFIKIVVTPKGKLPSYKGVLDKLAKVKLSLASSKELWVWEIRTGWHFYPVKENQP